MQFELNISLKNSTKWLCWLGLPLVPRSLTLTALVPTIMFFCFILRSVVAVYVTFSLLGSFSRCRNSVVWLSFYSVSKWSDENSNTCGFQLWSLSFTLSVFSFRTRQHSSRIRRWVGNGQTFKVEFLRNRFFHVQNSRLRISSNIHCTPWVRQSSRPI